MPYGIPKGKGGDSKENDSKMHRCVEDVMKKGHDKSSAIAICKKSLGFTKEESALAMTGWKATSTVKVEAEDMSGQGCGRCGSPGHHADSCPEAASTEHTASDLETGVQMNHRVPVELITDHKGNLAPGVEPAICLDCGEPISLHAQWNPTRQYMSIRTAGWDDGETSCSVCGPDGHCEACDGHTNYDHGAGVYVGPGEFQTTFDALHDEGRNDSSGRGAYADGRWINYRSREERNDPQGGNPWHKRFEEAGWTKDDYSCPDCDGTGADKYNSDGRNCSECHGTGIDPAAIEDLKEHEDFDKGWKSSSKTGSPVRACPNCSEEESSGRGIGEMINPGDCPSCLGGTAFDPSECEAPWGCGGTGKCNYCLGSGYIDYKPHPGPKKSHGPDPDELVKHIEADQDEFHDLKKKVPDNLKDKVQDMIDEDNELKKDLRESSKLGMPLPSQCPNCGSTKGHVPTVGAMVWGGDGPDDFYFVHPEHEDYIEQQEYDNDGRKRVSPNDPRYEPGPESFQEYVKDSEGYQVPAFKCKGCGHIGQPDEFTQHTMPPFEGTTKKKKEETPDDKKKREQKEKAEKTKKKVDKVNKTVDKGADAWNKFISTRVEELSTDVGNGIHPTPVEFITDHRGELEIGSEPATCKFCYEAMSDHSQWNLTHQASADDSFIGWMEAEPDFISKTAHVPSYDLAYHDLQAAPVGAICQSCGSGSNHTFGSVGAYPDPKDPVESKVLMHHSHFEAYRAGAGVEKPAASQTITTGEGKQPIVINVYANKNENS